MANKFCLYIDEKAQIIENKENSKPTKVICKIPFEYFKSNNFNPINLNLKNYKLLKNKK